MSYVKSPLDSFCFLNVVCPVEGLIVTCEGVEPPNIPLMEIKKEDPTGKKSVVPYPEFIFETTSDPTGSNVASDFR